MTHEDSIAKAIALSARVAVKVAWPVLQPMVGGTLLADEAHQMLDRDAGIDLVWERTRGTRIPVSVRYQRGGTDWRSFTLRQSELVKLRRALADSAAMRPHYMIQTYVDADWRLMSTAMCEVRRLVELMESVSAWRHNPADQTPFKAVFWDDFMGSGIWQYSTEDAGQMTLWSIA